MPSVTLLLKLFRFLSIASLSFAQTIPTSDKPAQVLPAAAQGIAAFASAPVHQVQLNGTASAYVGSLQPSGTFSATLDSTGHTKLQLVIGELSRIETTEAFGNTRKCKWAGQDGVEHDVAHHNCQIAVNWLVPDLDLQARITALTEAVVAKNEQGVAFQELALTQPPGDLSAPAALISRLSSVKVSLDPITFLPASLKFNIHPDNDAGLNIPIIVHYSDYRQINGVSLPFRIQKYLNNGLVLDLQVENAEVQ